MKIFAIADLHLSLNENIDKPMTVFGDGWEDYENRLAANWNAAISPEDVVLLPGDLSWGLHLEEAMDDLEWIHRLPGQKVLMKGNHDLWWSRITYLNTLYDDMFFLQNDCYVVAPNEDGTSKLAICGARGWVLPGSDEFTEHDQKIHTRELGRLRSSLDAAMKAGAESIVVAMHYPPADDVTRKSDFTELMEAYPVTDCVYGHLHGPQAFRKGIKGTHREITYRLISLDYLGAKPKFIREVTP